MLPVVSHPASDSGDTESPRPELLSPPRRVPRCLHLGHSKYTDVYKPTNSMLYEDNKILISKVLFLSHVPKS